MMPSITCGNCHGTHSSVSDVRWCHQNWKDTSQPAPYPDPESEAWNEVTGNGHFGAFAEDSESKTPKSSNKRPAPVIVPVKDRIYLDVPYRDKEEAKKFGAHWDRDAREWWVSPEDMKNNLEGLRPWFKKDMIEAQGDAVPDTIHTEETLPAGYYAIHTEEKGWMFYRVTWGKDRWEGRVFLEVQASDDLHRISNRDTRDKILALIALDPKGSAFAYGRQIGRCSNISCHRTLTKESSIARGMGDKCAAKRGWL